MNNTDVPTNARRYRIPATDLTLILERRVNPIGMKDTLVLLTQCLYSTTEKIHQGGKAATEPVEIFQHKYGSVQVQMEGVREQLTPFKVAQVFYGLATIEAQIGFYHETFAVVRNGVGLIARITIV